MPNPITGPSIRDAVDALAQVQKGDGLKQESKEGLVSRSSLNHILTKYNEFQSALQSVGVEKADIDSIKLFSSLRNQALTALKAVRKSVEAMAESRRDVSHRSLSDNIIKHFAEEDGSEPAADVVDEIGPFWIVTRATDRSELKDICFESDVAHVLALGQGGTLEPARILGIFKNEAKATKAAEAELKTRDEGMANSVVKYGFRKLKIAAKDWEKALSTVKASTKPLRSPNGWQWMGKDISVISLNDPIGGEWFERGGGSGKIQTDFASNVGIEGKKDLVDELVAAIKDKGSMADESEGKAAFT